jgi:3-hydroxyacyl-CoA dehydrogenase/enoyl-CoA hydratase/3-hydroxybutyryl-CoA epimerase
MTLHPPALEQFRLECQDNGLVHLVFDVPGRTMNVFSNAAIHELGAFAAWLGTSDVRGVLIRSGKDTAFCAGADLTELGVAYDMIVAAPPRDRFTIAFDHFFPLSAALRALETAGKPVAAAIAGLALGGGCELALAAHYRVLADSPRAAMGLPESLVGLLPGAGGTQRLPRLIGVEQALPILLDGARLAGQEALDAGLVDAVVPPGEEVAAAERWLLAASAPCQPWDRTDYAAPRPAAVSAKIDPVRARVMAQTHGLYPAPIAILDCVEHGLPQCFDGAIRSEMAIFAHLIQRPEPRNMIQTLFLGKTDYERHARKETLPGFIADVVEALRPMGTNWADPALRVQAAARIEPWAGAHSESDLRMADYAVVSQLGYPAYLGGPFSERRAAST